MYLVSILIPVYNVEKYIELCARSVFEQNFSSIEYIFVDDCSQDSTISILKRIVAEYPERSKNVHILKHDYNRGIATTRRTATEYASGTYIMHVDSDDHIDNNMIFDMYNIAVKNDADMVVGTIKQLLKDGITDLYSYSGFDKSEYLYQILTRKSPCNIWGRLIKREIIIKNNLFALDGLNQGDDYQVVPKIIYYANKISFSEAVYFYNRTNINSYTHSMSSEGIDSIIHSHQILLDFFNIGSRCVNQSVLNESSIYNKLALLSTASLKDYSKISNLYRSVDYRCFPVKLGHRILLKLLDYKCFYLTRFIVISYTFYMKYLIQR